MKNGLRMKTKSTVNTLKNHATSLAFAVDTALISCIYTATSSSQSTTVYGLIQTIALIICAVGGGIRCIFGGIALADAKGEGDGPAEHKAQNKIISGLALIAIGVAIKAINLESFLSVAS